MSNIKLIIELPEEVYKAYKMNPTLCMLNADQESIAKSYLVNGLINGIQLSKKLERKFEGIIVEYPSAESCTYTEYIGKPYFSIKYEENGKHFIGFGTYNPEVLSMYLQEYFIEADKK